MKRIKIIKNRSDIGAGSRGSDMGIDAIEIAAINVNNDYFNRHEFIDVETENESIYNKVKNTYSKRIEHVSYQCERVSNAVNASLTEQSFPLVISGDHSSALGTISGIKKTYPNKRLGVIWIDAHADIHSPYTSPSGNIHGMPLAAAMSEDNMDDKVNEVSNTSTQYWESMKNIGVKGQKVRPDDLVYFGVRDTEEPEDNLMEKLKLRNYMVHEVRHRGLEVCVDEALDRLKDCDMLYISFDVDSMDCDLISYGTGTPVPKGFDEFEIIKMIDRIIKSEKVICMEFVEVNPLLDHKGNKMGETAFIILDEVTKTLTTSLNI
ncbi:arginase [Pontimicrobium sp. SW4]|uniref:Arginase n=1 Tax=Pontimicrobium sp. SW4 TaxID=3153519 RepID=A0AAU7BQJ2_9FLAO